MEKEKEKEKKEGGCPLCQISDETLNSLKTAAKKKQEEKSKDKPSKN